MKYILSTILLLTNFLLFGQTLYPTGVAGCVARWDFSTNSNLSTLIDVSGNNNQANASNINVTTGWRNLPNTAGLFNGLNSQAEAFHSPTLDVNAFTIISLVKFTDFYSGTCNASQIVSKGYPYYIPGNYGLCIQDNYYDADCNLFSPNNMQSSIQAYNQSGNPSPGNYIQKNKWYFIAVTFDINEMKFYQVEMDSLNKASTISELQTIPTSMPLSSNQQNLSIGYHMNPNYPYWFNGKMDELVIFNRVLNTEELYSVYDYLFGTNAIPNATSFVEPKPSYSVYKNNQRIHINASNAPYGYVLRTISGQIIKQKNQADAMEEINIESFANQLLILEISDVHQRLIKKI